MEAVNVCFGLRQLFTAEVLAVAVNQLVEQVPLPLLLMRSLIQTVAAAPKLKPRVVETLNKLVQKQVRRALVWLVCLERREESAKDESERVR
eukprot:583987-Prorocentrum_minimum.AAC.3